MITKNTPHLNALWNCRISKPRGSIYNRQKRYQYKNDGVSNLVNSKKKKPKGIKKRLQVLRGNNLTSEFLESASYYLRERKYIDVQIRILKDITTNNFSIEGLSSGIK